MLSSYLIQQVDTLLDGSSIRQFVLCRCKTCCHVKGRFLYDGNLWFFLGFLFRATTQCHTKDYAQQNHSTSDDTYQFSFTFLHISDSGDYLSCASGRRYCILLRQMLHIHTHLRCRLVAVSLFLGCSLGNDITHRLIRNHFQGNLLIQLFFDEFRHCSLEGHGTCDKLEEHDTHGIDIRRLVLVMHITQYQLRGGIGCLADKLSCTGQLLVLCIQVIQPFGNTKVDNLHLPVCGNHDITWIQVTMDIALVMKCHQTRQDILHDEDGKAKTIVLVFAIKFLGERHLIAVLICCFSIQQVKEHHTL